MVRPVAVVAAMSQFRAGTRPGERTSASIKDVEDDELVELFGPAQADEPVNDRCADCPRRVSKNAERCHPCAARWLWVEGKMDNRPEVHRIAQIATTGPRCSRCRHSGIRNWRTHRIWHAAGGGTEQFSLAAYDRLMEER